MRRPGGWWRGKTTPAKVETYTRWSFHFIALIEVSVAGLSVFAQVGHGPAGALCLVVAAHAAVCAVTGARALDWTCGRREQPVRLLWTLGVLTAVLAAGAIAFVQFGPVHDDDLATAVGGLFGCVVTFGIGFMALGLPRRRVAPLIGGYAAGAVAVSLVLGVHPLAALLTSVSVVLGGGFLAFTSVFSVWLLNAVFELDEARETRARLAVAEERLRFGRDLHDVIGRNLAVIALKSELAVQLTRRGRPEGVEQMIEVQRIARESQREVRDVVRGYREADLEAELGGARGVLGAAGIRCEVTGDTAGLPGPVQSALGWVVREATTNVLRHGAAQRCAVTVRTTGERVVLTVENDGAGAAPGGTPGAPGGGPAGGRGGSGLAGLRERLTAVGGTLEAGPADGDVFRVVARVPLGAGVGAGAGASVAVGTGAGNGASVAAGTGAGNGASVAAGTGAGNGASVAAGTGAGDEA
ncbi:MULTISPECIES: sensor histidine kinase [Streptomyces]|uniref:Two-component system sensor histidine kinase DesK n=2 Tax=Streptomyces TaxID=1883 RepID=A0ABT9LGI2_STRGD|nr:MULTISPECIES: histidine kinase [Streptomyces]MDP9682783.1 two-component system sensor histidine kinase DesK [Streptomyces griseoviridis]GGS91743.1 histidine kinase [Streptomyces griseoviridis]GGU25408.1 histidine kinase [Streptomyces daghestanicus]GHI32413.1 histidine kinase [Streptomyces daghestanicus]